MCKTKALHKVEVKNITTGDKNGFL